MPRSSKAKHFGRIPRKRGSNALTTRVRVAINKHSSILHVIVDEYAGCTMNSDPPNTQVE